MAVDSYSGPSEVEPRPNTLITPEIQEGLVLAAIDRIAHPDFARRYAVIEASQSLKAIEEVERQPRAYGKREAKKEIRVEVRQDLAERGLRGLRGDDPRWQEAYQRICSEIDPETGLSRMDYWRQIAAYEFGISSGHRDSLAQAIETYERTRTDATDRAVLVHEDLRARFREDRVWNALDAWANTPDSRGKFGMNGLGYNGAIMHYIEYWANRAKRQRYTHMPDVTMSVESLVTHTEEFIPFVERTEHNTDGRNVMLIDSDGNERFYLLRPGGIFVVGISLAGDERRRITSIIPDSSEGYFDRVVENCLAGKDRGKLNKLGPDVTKEYSS